MHIFPCLRLLLDLRNFHYQGFNLNVEDQAL